MNIGKRITIAVLLLVSFWICHLVSADEEPLTVNSISFGMNAEEVERQLGEPYRKTVDADTIVYSYVVEKTDETPTILFQCILFDNSVSIMSYNLYVDEKNKESIISFLSNRYGAKPVSTRENRVNWVLGEGISMAFNYETDKASRISYYGPVDENRLNTKGL